jgi:SpoVK/Ycf46/Vps4 family AAA+-type ATPase
MQMRRKLENNTGDILNLINNPSFQKDLDAPITMNDFKQALKNISKSVSNLDLEAYVKWTNEFKSN